MKYKETVNSPDHYNKGKYETIDVILDVTQHIPGDQGFLVGNIIKYLSRYHFKGGKEDLRKAQNYMNRLLKIVEGEF